MTLKPMPYLGRIRSSEDHRDRRFTSTRTATTRTWRSWLAPEPSDQGETPHCVAHAGIHFLKAHNTVNNRDLPAQLDVYDQCQLLDEWPGQDYEGTSVRALMRYLMRERFIREYRWAYTVEQLMAHLIEVGPVVMGTTWTWGMFTPDSHGYIKPDTWAVGGHAYLLVAGNLNRKNPDGSIGAARLLNSWGEDWGQGGRAWLSTASLRTLLADYGEAALPIEVKK